MLLQGKGRKGVVANEMNSAGWYGTGDVPTYCHAGGNSAEVCTQVGATTIVIASMNGIGK